VFDLEGKGAGEFDVHADFFEGDFQSDTLGLHLL
jgi:hypothetical protein